MHYVDAVELISAIGALFPRGGPVQDLVLIFQPYKRCALARASQNTTGKVYGVMHWIVRERCGNRFLSIFSLRALCQHNAALFIV